MRRQCVPGSLFRVKTAQAQDPVCSQVRQVCDSEWPEQKFISPTQMPYFKERSHLTVCNNLLLFDGRIVVPEALRNETLQKVYTGHQGMERCRERVAVSVWWPGVTSDVREMVNKCRKCAELRVMRKAPLISTPLPEYPWQLEGTDLFELNKGHYIVVIDYFSRYPEVIKLSSTSVIAALKSVFARHGIPETLQSDNGPQYSSQEFTQFAEMYGFIHVSSSPRYPQSNGQVECLIQTVKRMLQKSNDPHLAILSYWSTPHSWCGKSRLNYLWVI